MFQTFLFYSYAYDSNSELKFRSQSFVSITRHLENVSVNWKYPILIGKESECKYIVLSIQFLHAKKL